MTTDVERTSVDFFVALRPMLPAAVTDEQFVKLQDAFDDLMRARFDAHVCEYSGHGRSSDAY